MTSTVRVTVSVTIFLIEFKQRSGRGSTRVSKRVKSHRYTNNLGLGIKVEIE